MDSPLKPTEKELNHIFLFRKKTVLYRRIPLDTKKKLMEEFKKSAYPNRLDYENMTKRINLSIHKIQNWFKYQRKNEFLSKKAVLKNYRRKHKFEKTEKRLLERAFRQNNTLNEKTLNILQKEIKCKEVHIKRWFYYRNQKLRNIQEKKQASFNANDCSGHSHSSDSTTNTQVNLKCENKSPFPVSPNQLEIAANSSKIMPLVNPQFAYTQPQNSFNNYAFLNRMYQRPVLTPLNNTAFYPPNNVPNLNLGYFNQSPYNCFGNFPNVSQNMCIFPQKYGYFY